MRLITSFTLKLNIRVSINETLILQTQPCTTLQKLGGGRHLSKMRYFMTKVLGTYPITKEHITIITEKKQSAKQPPMHMKGHCYKLSVKN